ncbi:hypothetical protein C0Q44_20715 [Paenibacillus sp. PCH8]|uniref:hypothetical protein n=1 Tax=Paenibacillus sp. PCH8 TaxID=2066524 RepID=UPI000D48F056|nr:hypothetical protein [Paenibacillus sp. PCH8]PQP82077.1 hypothetical protein C0Q44_20715 [Paenibacillus sp. PCH8]
MKVLNYASELAVKTFVSASAKGVEEQMNTWLAAYPHTFVTGLEIVSVVNPLSNELEFAAIVVYQPSEQDQS